MSDDHADEYARALAALQGDEFQDEVCARLQSVVSGFQSIPAVPHGDGGLDAFSHGGERGYCCYGQCLASARTDKGRASALVKKFAEDLQRLFELATSGGALVHRDNPELKSIFPRGLRLKEIKLITNWFGSHRVIGPIQTRVREYVAASRHNFVDPGVCVAILGPKELANEHAVDELTMVRVRHRGFATRVNEAANAIAITDPKGFDLKMSVLREMLPGKGGAIDDLAGRLRHDWRIALAFERDLGDTLPQLHQSLESDRGRILVRTLELMLASADPWARLAEITELAEGVLRRDFAASYGPILMSVASGEVARLVGECPIDWRKPLGSNGDT